MRILCREDAGYPEPLRQIPDPPICLYVMGEIRREDALSIAIVGSRQASIYGLEQAQRFAELLSQTGLTVISGMARGIDQAAHMAAIRTGGRTIAVLGCGLSLLLSARERRTARPDRQMRRGRSANCPCGPPHRRRPSRKRNRIIAGLSLGTLVIEAARRSGALITARVASEYNREVFALPGRVDTPTAMGTNDLISQGFAKLVTNLGDILDALGDVGESLAQYAGGKMLAGTAGRPSRQARPKTASGARRMPPRPPPGCLSAQAVVYKVLTTSPMHMEQVARAARLPIGQVSAALTLLQLKGLVRQLPGNQFARRA